MQRDSNNLNSAVILCQQILNRGMERRKGEYETVKLPIQGTCSSIVQILKQIARGQRKIDILYMNAAADRHKAQLFVEISFVQPNLPEKNILHLEKTDNVTKFLKLLFKPTASITYWSKYITP